MHNSILTNGEKTSISPSNIDATADKIQFSYDNCGSRPKSSIQKIGGYTVSLNHDNTCNRCRKSHTSHNFGLRPLLQDQIDAWAKFGTCQTLPLMAM
jgi:maltose phosphorylase